MGHWSRIPLAAGVAALLLVIGSGASARAGEGCLDVQVPDTGTVQLAFDRAELLGHGLTIVGGEPRVVGGRLVLSAGFVIAGGDLFGLAISDGQLARVLGGQLQVTGHLTLARAADSQAVVNTDSLRLTYDPRGVEEPFGIVDGASGHRLFDVVGPNYEYDADRQAFSIRSAYVGLSEEFAAILGEVGGSSPIVGTLQLDALTTAADVPVSDFLPPADPPGPGEDGGTRGVFPTPGPDVMVCVLPNTEQFGRVGAIGSGTVGLAIGTTSANNGDTPLDWFVMPNTHHPVIAQNLYRKMTVDGSTRFEQIGQSWLKHGFCALQLTQCFTCTPVGPGCEQRLGSGCSDPYSSDLNATQSNLGARSWVHGFKGTFPNTANNHAGHSHNAIDHRLQVADADLAIAGAIYYAEGHYVAADDSFAGNQFNNVSYRRVNVTGPSGSGVFTFGNSGGTIREQPAINAWDTATQTTLMPLVGDGIAILAYEVTDLGNGLHHYEYALYNMNHDGAFNSFSIPLPAGVNVTNVDFHFVRNHGPQVTGSTFDNTPWTMTVGSGAVTWATDNEATNVNANALRWGTLFNFRFDADQPPTPTEATLGLYRSGGTTTAATVGPSAPPPEPCPGDFNQDGLIGLEDLTVLLASYGSNAGGDMDGDGDTDLEDLTQFLALYGTACP